MRNRDTMQLLYAIIVKDTAILMSTALQEQWRVPSVTNALVIKNQRTDL